MILAVSPIRWEDLPDARPDSTASPYATYTPAASRPPVSLPVSMSFGSVGISERAGVPIRCTTPTKSRVPYGTLTPLRRSCSHSPASHSPGEEGSRARIPSRVCRCVHISTRSRGCCTNGNPICTRRDASPYHRRAPSPTDPARGTTSHSVQAVVMSRRDGAMTFSTPGRIRSERIPPFPRFRGRAGELALPAGVRHTDRELSRIPAPGRGEGLPVNQTQQHTARPRIRRANPSWCPRLDIRPVTG